MPGNGVADVGPGSERNRGFGWSDVVRCPPDDAGFAVDNGELPVSGWFEIVRSLWIEPTECLSTASFKAGRVCKGGLGIRAFAREPFDQRAKKIKDRNVIAWLLFGGGFGSQWTDRQVTPALTPALSPRRGNSAAAFRRLAKPLPCAERDSGRAGARASS